MQQRQKRLEISGHKREHGELWQVSCSHPGAPRSGTREKLSPAAAPEHENEETKGNQIVEAMVAPQEGRHSHEKSGGEMSLDRGMFDQQDGDPDGNQRNRLFKDLVS